MPSGERKTKIMEQALKLSKPAKMADQFFALVEVEEGHSPRREEVKGRNEMRKSGGGTGVNEGNIINIRKKNCIGNQETPARSTPRCAAGGKEDTEFQGAGPLFRLRGKQRGESRRLRALMANKKGKERDPKGTDIPEKAAQRANSS